VGFLGCGEGGLLRNRFGPKTLEGTGGCRERACLIVLFAE
jgi:hypothetical protein